MADWKKEISDSFAAIDARRIEIHKPLYSLLEELKRENSIREASFDLISEHPLAWNVIINGKAVQIVESEVTFFQNPQDESSKDVTEALKELLVKKFT
ncbi:hypothetical protein [Paenibacillus polymyxa]|uniref:hypothetical protein n=1 Tax=Paenibacillus TaxID=44249 RepID=UPI00202475B5|nr:hypothetical protein [Paenibacillus polymyxa]URJ42163.1 hypothetical protein MF627_001817 [Paenibacillus polymyxa]